MTRHLFALPWPPSTNSLWRAVRGRNILSEKARAYYHSGQCAMLLQRPSRPMTEPVAVTITLRPPNRRRYDLDNRIKAVLDLLTKSGVWLDDDQVTRLTVQKGEIHAGGAAIVTVEAVQP